MARRFNRERFQSGFPAVSVVLFMFFLSIDSPLTGWQGMVLFFMAAVLLYAGVAAVWRSQQALMDYRAELLLDVPRSETSGRGRRFILFLRPSSLCESIVIPNPDRHTLGNRILGLFGLLTSFLRESRTTLFVQLVARIFEDLAPIVSLGRPDSLMGPGRAPVSDELWRGMVVRALHRASLVLMVPYDNPNIRWEIATVLDEELLDKCLFMMPPATGTLGELQAAEAWELARRRYAGLGLSFPPYDPGGAFFSLEREGSVSEKTPLHLNASAGRGTRFSRSILQRSIESLRCVRALSTPVRGKFEKRMTAFFLDNALAISTLTLVLVAALRVQTVHAYIPTTTFTFSTLLLFAASLIEAVAKVGLLSLLLALLTVLALRLFQQRLPFWICWRVNVLLYSIAQLLGEGFVWAGLLTDLRLGTAGAAELGILASLVILLPALTVALLVSVLACRKMPTGRYRVDLPRLS